MAGGSKNSNSGRTAVLRPRDLEILARRVTCVSSCYSLQGTIREDSRILYRRVDQELKELRMVTIIDETFRDTPKVVRVHSNPSQL